MQRRVFSILLILLERVQSGARNRGSGYIPELEEQRTTLVFGSSQNQRRPLGGHHRIRGLNMGRLIPLEKSERRHGSGGMYGTYNWMLWVRVFHGTHGCLIVRVSSPEAD